MKRTIKRYSQGLNSGKWQTVVDVAGAYALQKDLFLVDYGRSAVFAQYGSHREARDELVAAGYKSPCNLQARMWKLALKDAFETVDRQWQAQAEGLRSLVMAQRKESRFTEEQAHYAFWVLKSSQRMAQLVGGRAPAPGHFAIAPGEMRQAVAYLRRVIRRERGANPRVKKARSFTLDAEMYHVFEAGGRQYVKIMTSVPRQRLVIPLTGQGAIRGNLRVVLDEEKRRVEIHRAVDVRPRKAKGKPVAVDLGVTETITDSDGARWGKGQGKILATYSDQICDQGRKRNRLRAIQERHAQKGNRGKVRRLGEYNLGKEKRRRRRRKMRQTLVCQINRAINELQREKKPSLLVHENLRGLRGKFKSKRLSRIVNTWMRGLIKDRLAFKASAGGSRREQVNPSYSSQMCPRCGFVHHKNRQGDRFQCLFCGRGGDSDAVAAWNLLERRDDAAIRLWTPAARVRAILLDRFRRRVESWAFDFPPGQADLVVLAMVEVSATVPGKTQDTPRPVPQVDVAEITMGHSESETAAAATRQRITDLDRFVQVGRNS
ncbi:MAG: transposase [Chloroflexi bacterium]|nr:transposase [Chloroflexota bacterium]